ncbi:MAG TPA: hypothetical protein VND21_04315 [Planctomycetota bacterium]|nr:hypothetical protein [Planctomycetota bacterium]
MTQPESPVPAAAWSVSPIDPTQRRATIVAAADGRPVATLTGGFPNPGLFVFERIDVEAGADAEPARRVLAGALATVLGPRGGNVLVVDSEVAEPWQTALEGAGFHPLRRKVVVRRRLDELLPPAGNGFLLRSLADVGEAEFKARMVLASEGDPFEERQGADRDTDAEWRELLTHAGSRFDPTKWHLVDDAQGPVGVVLPQALRDDLGTLSYLGVVPTRRGVGFGTKIHAMGLHALAAQGRAVYVGSTDVRNVAMRHVFQRNGCPVIEAETHYKAPSFA